MTQTSNASGWVTVSGETEPSTSTMRPETTVGNAPQTTVGSGGLEIIGTGPVRRDTPAAYTQGEDAPVGGSIMSTVKSPQGGTIGDRNPNGNDIVSIGGMSTSISAAVYAGLLVRNSDGSYSEPSQPTVLKDPTASLRPKETTQTPEEQPQETHSGVSFGEEADAVMQELLSEQNPGEIYKTIDSVLHRGDLHQSTIERMASKAGIEPDEMQAKLETVWSGAYEQAMSHMSAHGVGNDDAFEAFLRDNPRFANEMTEAARNYFVHHATTGLESVAGEYLAKADIYDTQNIKALLTEAGYDFEDSPQGGLRVHVEGTSIPWEIAVKQKIITFSVAE